MIAVGLPILATEHYLQDYVDEHGVIYRVCAYCNNWYTPIRKHQKYCHEDHRYAHHYEMNREKKIVYMRDYRKSKSVERGESVERKQTTRKTRDLLLEELRKQQQANFEKEQRITDLEDEIKGLRGDMQQLIAMLQNGVHMPPRVEPKREFSPPPKPATLPEQDTTQAFFASIEGSDF
jgi:hypothetical protein